MKQHASDIAAFGYGSGAQERARPGGELRKLYVTERARLRRLVRRIVGSADVAEDVVQDAFVKLSGRDIGSADVGLLVRTAQNLARDVMRSDRVRAAYADQMRPEQIAAGPVAPDDAAARREELGDLLDALQALPERTRRIFLLSRVDEVSYPQIARMLGVSVSTVEKDMISAIEFCRSWRRRRG
ncbi:RNA polymerase sigma factor [Methylopila henanensis]|uniref:RNA polymerase sigma factor n=1 Tax=Methylopila henanensis TaxID=873516 RepID=A0ABW4K5B9_9HYPH